MPINPALRIGEPNSATFLGTKSGESIRKAPATMRSIKNTIMPIIYTTKLDNSHILKNNCDEINYYSHTNYAEA